MVPSRPSPLSGIQHHLLLGEASAMATAERQPWGQNSILVMGTLGWVRGWAQ